MAVNLLPSTRMVIWGLVFGLLAIAVANNFAAIGRLVGPRT